MDRLQETIIDLALEVGFRMGQLGHGFQGDSREAVRRILETAEKFTEDNSSVEEDYLTAVQDEAAALYWQMWER